MSKRGFLFGLVALLVAMSFAGCLGDDDVDGDTNDDADSGDGGDGDMQDVADDDGDESDTDQGDDESDADDPVAPTAAFQIMLGNATNATAGTPIDFDASESADSEGQDLSYAWDFGDDTTGEGVALNHTYELAGNYTVTLTVTNEDGLSDTTDQTLRVVNATAGAGVLYTAPGSILLPNPAIGTPLYSSQFPTLDDHTSNGGEEDIHYQVHTVTGVPDGIESLRFRVEYETPDSQTVMKLAIKIFPEDGSEAVDSSTFGSGGSPDRTLNAEDIGETTYHVFVYSGTGVAVDYDLTVSYA